MPNRFTRRSFLNNAALAGLATQMDVVSRASPMARATRQGKESFDGGWRFSRGDFPGAQTAEFPDEDWTALDLPHDWSIAGPYDENEPSGGSGGYLPTGIGWYRKTFALPAAAAGKHVRIQFDGIYQRSEVWINGHALGLRPNGYISLVYDVTPHLNFAAPNIIAVRVDNSLQPNSRWYSGSGIYRHTWLSVADPVHIAPWGIAVTTSDVSKDGATIVVAAKVASDTGARMPCTLDFRIVDQDGNAVAAASVSGAIDAKGEREFVQRLPIASPRLWSVPSPNLYTLETTLHAGGADSGPLSTRFGIRDARFDADRGFLLNGEGVKLNGVCLHHDCGAVGAAVPERMWTRRLALLKEMGCNAIRLSHNPPAPEFLDLCDEMGFLVMAEAFDEWRQPKLQTPQYGYHKYFDEWAERDLADMIARDRNHPSIVIWSAGNEVPDQTVAEGPQTLQRLLDVFHKMDPARPVTVACDNIVAEPHPALPQFLEKLDVVGYNYVDRWRDRRETFYADDRHDYPMRKVIGTESVAVGGVRGAYRLGDDPPLFGERAQNRDIEVEQLQKFVQTYDYVSGDFMWTGIDYLGEARWPYKLAVSGVLDTCGFAKDGYYFYQSQWSERPVLHLFPHWNWAGHEDEIVVVRCYTNCDTVELFLNGRSMGVKGYAFPRPGMVKQWGTYPDRAKALQTTADLHLSWDVPYRAGTLRAVGTKDGQVVSTFEVKTTGEPAAVRLTGDRDLIESGGGDVAHVKVEIVDRDGLLVPTAANEVLFKLRGEGRIIGVDNGQPDSVESYQGDRRKAFNGLALVLLQSQARPGSMTLTATSAGLASSEIRIEVADRG